jgi:DNA polymerase III subunit alpha
MIHLHNHSTRGSLRDAYSKIPEMVQRAKELNMDALAITEHGSMTTSIEFFDECKKQGIKAILGLEAYFTPQVGIKDRSSIYHLILLAYSQEGYRNLVKLNTEAHQNKYYKPRIDMDILRKYSVGIVCTSACMGSIVNTDNGEYWAKEFHNIFGDKFYLEMVTETTEDQRVYNLKIAELCQRLNIEPVLTSDSHYVFQSQAEMHRLWVKQGKDNDYYPTDSLYLQSEEEARSNVAYLPRDIVDRAIHNTHIIADLCNVNAEPKADLMPKYPSDNPVKELKDLCRSSWKTKVIGVIPKEKIPEYQQRLRYEMQVITDGGYTDYMLLIYDFLKWYRDHGYIHGFGRGSCGGSLVAWLLQIVALDPIEHHLLFERFLNPSRVTQADIDVDLMDRDKGIEYLQSRYKYVLPIRTIGTVKAKSAIQYAGRALKMNPKEINSVSKGIIEIDDITDPQYDKLKTVAHAFEGLCDKYGMHASGYIVTNSDPTDYVSIEKQGDYFVINQDYHLLEHIGFLKLDLLALTNLAIIKETIDSIPDKVDVWNIPLDDAEVYQQYADGNTSTIFQVESSMMQGYSKRLKISCFDDIVALLSIGRPAVIQSGMADKYIECKDSGELTYLHPLLEPILSRTYSALIFQESVMQILQGMAGMSLADADNARRIMGRKIPEELHQIIPGFIQGCKDNNIPEDVANEVVQWIINSSSYLFNASHAVNYSYLSYVTAYLKYHWPIEYMCAVLNNEIGDIKKTVEYVKECKRMGITVTPPNLSVGNDRWAVNNGEIVMGLHAIKGIGKNLCITPNSTFLEVVSSNSKGVTEALIRSGSLDYLGLPRGLMLSNLVSLQDMVKRESQCKAKIAENTLALKEATDNKARRKARRLLDLWKSKLADVEATKALDAEDYDEIAGEVSVLGFSFHEIPRVKVGKVTKIYKKIAKNGPMAWLTMISDYGEFRCTCFAPGWKLIGDKVKQGESYEFVVDDNGILEEFSVDGEVYKTNERR